MAGDDFGRQEQLRRDAEEREKLLAERKEQIVEAHGEGLGQRVAVYGADDEVSKAAVGLIAERIAKNTINIQDFNASRINVQVEQRRVGEAVDEAYRRAEQGREEPTEERGKQAGAGLRTPEWEAQAETIERQRGQHQRYDDLRNSSASAEQTDEAALSEAQQSKAEGQDGKRDRVAEFLKAEQLDREERKAAMQEMMRDAGHEITEQKGQGASQDRGGGLSI